MLDLIIRNGRVVDYKNHLNTVTDISIKDGKITNVGRTNESATQEINASGLLVVPGIIDSHMHASSWLAGPLSFRMLAAAGVTTAMEMAGPLECVKKYMRENGTGLNIACLEYLRAGENLPSNNPSVQDIERVALDALKRGAFGIKLLGGHYPITSEAEEGLLRYANKQHIWLAVHAGSLKHGSNIDGMREVIELANGTPFHLCHINAYCRGAIKNLEDEISEAVSLLEMHPEIDTESYLSPINACSGKCINKIPESNVTKNCLALRGYSIDEDGLRAALNDGFARAHKTENGLTELAEIDEGVSIWESHKTDTPISFYVNPSLSSFYFATKKRKNNHYLIDSFCTDGGGIPRNVIIQNGLSLVKFGAMTIEEFVLKSSWAAAQLMGLKTKGHFSTGADADITIIDYNAQVPVHSFVMGSPVLLNKKIIGKGGTLITTKEGKEAAINAGLGSYVVDMDAIFDYRLKRFNQ